ncbi:MAG TPA: hypothetical protein VHE61_01920 [Opitutaceae bacterium]|nr:hypothetical protein [Opitutaceae bacterium]
MKIIYADVPRALTGALVRGVRYEFTDHRILLSVDGIARYLIEDGRQIAIARDRIADDRDIRVFLLSSVFGALFHQRHDLVLQGSAINCDGDAIVFIGSSGIGKSTLAAAFREEGHAVLADDFCVVRPGADGRMYAFPAFPEVKLWPDSLEHLGIAANELPRVRDRLEKRIVSMGDNFDGSALPVRGLYELCDDDIPEPKVIRVDGVQKLIVLTNNIHRVGFLATDEAKANSTRLAMKLAQQATVSIVLRSRNAFRLAALVASIESDLQKQKTRSHHLVR